MVNDPQPIDTSNSQNRAAGKVFETHYSNAIFYLVRSACAQRMLPKDLPLWKSGTLLTKVLPQLLCDVDAQDSGASSAKD